MLYSVCVSSLNIQFTEGKIYDTYDFCIFAITYAFFSDNTELYHYVKYSDILQNTGLYYNVKYRNIFAIHLICIMWKYSIILQYTDVNHHVKYSDICNTWIVSSCKIQCYLATHTCIIMWNTIIFCNAKITCTHHRIQSCLDEIHPELQVHLHSCCMLELIQSPPLALQCLLCATCTKPKTIWYCYYYKQPTRNQAWHCYIAAACHISYLTYCYTKQHIK